MRERRRGELPPEKPQLKEITPRLTLSDTETPLDSSPPPRSPGRQEGQGPWAAFTKLESIHQAFALREVSVGIGWLG